MVEGYIEQGPGGALGVLSEKLHDVAGPGADFAIGDRSRVNLDHRHDLFVAGGDEGLLHVFNLIAAQTPQLDGKVGGAESEHDLARDSGQHFVGAACVEDIIFKGEKVARRRL